MIRFVDPWFFLLFLPIALFFLYRNRSGRIIFSNISTLKKVSSSSRIKFHPRLFLFVLRIVALIFFVIALARPQAGKMFSEAKSDGVDIVLALDTSGSMSSLDFFLDNERVERIEVLRKLSAEFVKKRANDRLALVVFGEEAYLQCPLTLDHGIVLDFIQKTAIGMAGGDRTAIGSAIAVSTARLKDLKAKSKVIILATDGENNAGRVTPLVAAEIAHSLNAKVYTIGIGSKEGGVVKVDTMFGPTLQRTESRIDEDLLTKIAEKTGGKYFRATDTKRFAEIYAEIDKLEKTEVKVKEYTEYEELFGYAIIAGLIALLLEIGLANTLLRKIP